MLAVAAGVSFVGAADVVFIMFDDVFACAGLEAPAAACSRCLEAAARWLRQRRSNSMEILFIRSKRRESLSHSRANC